MQKVRFSTVILLLVLALLAASSAILLTPAFLGSEKALQHEIRLAYERDQRALNSLIEARFKNIQQISQEVIEARELRWALNANNPEMISRVIDNLLTGDNGQHIDAIVIESNQGVPTVGTNSSLLGVQLPLEKISQHYAPSAIWNSVNVEADGEFYSVLRLTLQVVDERFGEVIGKMHTFVLLNDNYWIIGQLQGLFGSQAISLSLGGQLLDELEGAPEQLHNLHAAGVISKGVLTTENSILREHSLQVGSSERYSVRTLLPNNAYFALRDAYVSNLSYAALLVMVLGIVTMLVIQYLTRSSLSYLTQYAEQVPESGSPQPFRGGRFKEFVRVGNAVEKMLLRIRDRDKHLSSIIDHSPGLIFIKDMDQRYQLVNTRLAELFNLTPSQMIGKRDQWVLSDELMASVLKSDQQLLKSHHPTQYEMKIETDKGLCTFLVSKFPIFCDKGTLESIGGIATDITAIKQVEDQLRLAQQVFAETGEAIIVLDQEQSVLTSNRAFMEMGGVDECDIPVAAHRFLAAYPDILHQLHQAHRWQGECTLECGDGSSLPVLVSATLLSSMEGENRYVILFRDITNLKIAEQRLQRLALYDNLTGLPNRSLFNQQLEKVLNRDTQLITAVLFIDLDRFKSINDTYGHSVGDQLLLQVADRLRTCVNLKDSVSRLGGDEFTVILRDIPDRSQVEPIARRITTTLRKPYDLGPIRCFTSASIGVAIAGKDGEDVETLTRHADLAMYQAKAQGRDIIQFFDQAINARHQQRHQYEEDLRKAVDNNELFVVYQPRFDITGQHMRGAEALVRWCHPVHGAVSPGEFIPIAEASNLIVQLGRFVLFEACKQAAAWNADGYQLGVSVNLSPRQLHERDLVKDISRALGETGLPPHLLELEITETHVMENIDQFLPLLNEIREMGVTLAVDDFGTGYSSLMYLKKLPVDIVKIDRSFIMDVPGDTDDENLVRAIISMSHSLRLRVVAEGVETEEQQQFLCNLGCDQLQGFLFGRPDSVTQLKALAAQQITTPLCDLDG